MSEEPAGGLAAPVRRPPRVLVAGHDFKFFGVQERALRAAGAVVLHDVWSGHDEHDAEASEGLLARADVVVAAWCLANAVWYARHRRPGQRLVVQLHRFELETAYPHDLDVDAVDLVVVPGPHLRDEACARFGWPPGRVAVVANPVEVERFDRAKSPGAAWTLGLLGWDRRLKRLDLALDLLERLRRDDERFRLKLKGQPGRGAPEYFEAQQARIAALDGAVDVEPFGAAVEEWFAGVGFVLSLSDVESFHLALAEGMASRAVPVIRRRAGTDALWPPEWVHDDVEAMAGWVSGLAGTPEAAQVGEQARAHVAAHYAADVVTAAWRRLLGC